MSNPIHQLKGYYSNELSEHLSRIEKHRKALILRFGITLGLGIIAVPIFAIYLLSVIKDPLVLTMFIPVFGLIAVFIYILYESAFKNTSFYREYKRDIINRLIKYINPTLHYDKLHFIPLNEFFKSGFFDKYSNLDYDGDDFVSGSVDNVKIEFSELDITFKKKEDAIKFGNKHLFRGLFFIAKCEKPFPADVIIEPSNEPNHSGYNYIGTGNAAFDSFFKIRIPIDGDEERALEMLNDEIIESILKVKNNIPNDLHISFIYDEMFIAVKHDKGLFEPALGRSVLNFQDISNHFFDLYYPIALIEIAAAHKHSEIPSDRNSELTDALDIF